MGPSHPSIYTSIHVRPFQPPNQCGPNLEDYSLRLATSTFNLSPPLLVTVTTDSVALVQNDSISVYFFCLANLSFAHLLHASPW